MIKKILLSIFISAASLVVNAQDTTDYMTGLLPDDGTYNTIPEKAELITRDYTVVPSAYSLKQYAPVVRSQSQFGTCTSWATVYAARTIAEAISCGWTDKQNISKEAFSPLYIYAQIKYKGDENCQRGSHIYNAMDVLKYHGVVKNRDFDYLCASPDNLTSTLRANASQHKIDDYFTLFKLDNISCEAKVNRVKKALAENCPVVIAMHLPASFHKAGGDWSGIDVNPDAHGYHAMCVVGYDDNHPGGGAFEIMNSWGRNWGAGGYTWVKYNDFGKYVDQAYEMFVKKKKDADNHSVSGLTLGGEIELRLSNGEIMKAEYDKSAGYYRLNEFYISGTRYRAYITNNEPAYVYVIGSDLSNNPTTVFPPAKDISPALTYKGSSIAIPDERYYIELDDKEGTDYMCVLYSSNPLDIEAIKQKISSTAGTFVHKVEVALGENLISASSIDYGQSEIKFTAKANKGSVVPIIIAIDHK